MDIESGGMVSGKWINPVDGTIINVMNTVIDENNQMLIITDKGTLDMATFSNNFIQCDEQTLEALTPIASQQQTPVQRVEIDNSSSVVEPITTSVQQHQPKQTTNAKQDTTSIIDKLFSKIESKPNIKIDIDWEDFPADQVNMLINFLDVKKEDISRYIIDNYLDEYAIIFALNSFLEDKKIGEN